MPGLTHRKAKQEDLEAIIALLLEDEFGKNRESKDANQYQMYRDAFLKIEADENQYLMVVEKDFIIVATCHLTIMPSLTLQGSTRLNIEAVRVSEKLRGEGLGKWMLNSAIEYGKSKGARIVQLTTDKRRIRARHFYETLGFTASHEGMKLKLGTHA